MHRHHALVLPLLLCVAAPLPAEDPETSEVVRWIADHAVALDAVEAGNGFDDLDGLFDSIGDARIVSLGEATHGSREFFQMKHRMLEYLVSELDFNVFAIEANWPESLAVNRYVLTGEGDPREALAGLYFWTWNTEEVLALIEWMREYNADPDHDRKVKFFGFDMQTARVAVACVRAFLETVDPETASDLAEHLDLLATAEAEMAYRQAPNPALGSVLTALLERFDGSREDWIDASTEEEWTLARQHLVVVIQAESSMSLSGMEMFDHRDRSMAENLAWLVDQEDPDVGVVVWAHNGHVSYAGYGEKIHPMGYHLREEFGDLHRNVGFAFNQGSFQAKDPSEGYALKEFTVGPAPAGTLDATLAATGLDLFWLDLKSAPDEGPIRDWIDETRTMRSVGAVYQEGREQNFVRRISPSENYDTLLFFRETTRARPLIASGSVDPAGERK